MDVSEYRKRGKEMVDYIADYLENIRRRDVFPDVSPGYMRDLVPEVAPTEGECWDNIFQDVERIVMPGVTHWQSPHMHAYFPALNSFPSLLGEMLSDGINCLGFTWASSPACTELEAIVMDWLGEMVGLPSDFLHSNEQTLGGGVIQTSASEATFVALLAARSEAIRHYRVYTEDDDIEDAVINAKLVAYCSDQAHSSVEKATLIGLVKLHLLPSDDQLSLRGDVLRAAIEEDKANGLIPFFLCATCGTTGACAFDNLEELGTICEEENIWMHVDAAYAGSAFVCPEFRQHMNGVQHAQSFAFNPSKWLMVNFDCTAMWVKNSGALHKTFNVQPLYLKHENTGDVIDYMHWQIPLSRRFRSLKLWFVIRSFGINGLQEHIRKGVNHAKNFENLVRQDSRFEVAAKRHLGMVVFRLKGENELTEELLKRINNDGKVHMVPAALQGKYVIRFTVTSQYTTDEDIQRDWYIIRKTAAAVLSKDTDSLWEDISVEVLGSTIKRPASEHLHFDAAIRREDYDGSGHRVPPSAREGARAPRPPGERQPRQPGNRASCEGVLPTRSIQNRPPRKTVAKTPRDGKRPTGSIQSCPTPGVSGIRPSRPAGDKLKLQTRGRQQPTREGTRPHRPTGNRTARPIGERSSPREITRTPKLTGNRAPPPTRGNDVGGKRTESQRPSHGGPLRPKSTGEITQRTNGAQRPRNEGASQPMSTRYRHPRPHADQPPKREGTRTTRNRPQPLRESHQHRTTTLRQAAQVHANAVNGKRGTQRPPLREGTLNPKQTGDRLLHSTGNHQQQPLRAGSRPPKRTGNRPLCQHIIADTNSTGKSATTKPTR